jgi:hypothetical protein
MHQIPDAVDPLLYKLADGLPKPVGSNLVGLYVYGSVLGPEFDPDRSDVDCIAVTRRPLDGATFRRLEAWLTEAVLEEPWFARLQMPALVKQKVLVDDPQACLYQFGVLKRSGSDGNPIIWMDFFWRGRTLIGPDPKSFIPEITADILHRALVREVEYLREELVARPDGEWRDIFSYRAYAILTLCRILYSFRTGDVTSKPKAARWAMGQTPIEWHDLIQRALGAGEIGGLEQLPISRIAAFIDYVNGQLNP